MRSNRAGARRWFGGLAFRVASALQRKLFHAPQFDNGRLHDGRYA